MRPLKMRVTKQHLEYFEDGLKFSGAEEGDGWSKPWRKEKKL